MRTQWRALWLALLAAGFVNAEPITPAPDAPRVEEVLVSGAQPGPGLWRVTHGEHSLWLLGSHQPLPKKMAWKAAEVESLIATADQVLFYDGLDQQADINFFRGLTLMPALLAAAKNPSGARLQDIMPESLYARWQVLKTRYLGANRRIERWRPTFAAQKLRSAAIAAADLVHDRIVHERVEKLAKRHKVARVHIGVRQKVAVERPRQVLKKFARTPFPDVECFERSIDQLEHEIETLQQRANAWAVGDIATLRHLHRPDQRGGDCIAALVGALTSGDLADELGEAERVAEYSRLRVAGLEELKARWLNATEQALQQHQLTIAVVPIALLLTPNDYLDDLRRRGYNVIEPD